MAQVEVGAVTHVGRRNNNEDAFGLLPELGLYAVADGMGGYEGGEVASGLAIRSLLSFVERSHRDPEATWPCRALKELAPPESLLRAGVVQADREIHEHKAGALSQMGSTLVALWLCGGAAVVAHVGDSRIYRWRAGTLEALTTDHSVWAEMQAAGMDPASSGLPYRHQITRALGIRGAEPELQTLSLEEGDLFLLCSDGLHDVLSAERLGALLAEQAPAQALCERLVEAAYAQGGQDNITAVIVRLVGPAQAGVTPRRSPGEPARGDGAAS